MGPGFWFLWCSFIQSVCSRIMCVLQVPDQSAIDLLHGVSVWTVKGFTEAKTGCLMFLWEQTDTLGSTCQR